MDNCSDILENVDLLQEKMDRFQRNMDFYMRKITNTLTTFVEVISLGTQVVEALKSECRKVRQNPVTNNISNHHLPAIDDKKKKSQIKHTADDIVRMKDIINNHTGNQLEPTSYSAPRKTANKYSTKQSEIIDISTLDSAATDTSSDFTENPLVQSSKSSTTTEIISSNKKPQTNKKSQEKTESTSETNNLKNATPSSSHFRKRKSNAPNVSISRKSPRISAHPPGYFQTKPAVILYIDQREESTRTKESRPNHSVKESNRLSSTKKVVDSSSSTERLTSSTENCDEADQEQTGLAKSYLRNRQARKN